MKPSEDFLANLVLKRLLQKKHFKVRPCLLQVMKTDSSFDQSLSSSVQSFCGAFHVNLLHNRFRYYLYSRLVVLVESSFVNCQKENKIIHKYQDSFVLYFTKKRATYPHVSFELQWTGNSNNKFSSFEAPLDWIVRAQSP